MVCQGLCDSQTEEQQKLKSSTKFLGFLIIHNFSVYFFYLNHKMLKNTFLMVKNSLQIGLYSPPRFRIYRLAERCFNFKAK